MLRHYDEDSGRSSCSAASGGLSPVLDNCEDKNVDLMNNKIRTQEIGTNTDLKVSLHPRSCVINSPDEKDPFPSCRFSKSQRKGIFHVFGSLRRGGLSNAYSTLDIASSTQIEQPKIENNAISLTGIDLKDNGSAVPNLHDKPTVTNFRRGKPVQRAASRLYRAESALKDKLSCIGPEFIVRASQPVRTIDLTLPANSEKRLITVVLLNGQRVEIFTNPNTVTAGHLFEALVHSEKYEHNFMLGIAALVGGDFVFLPDDYKIKKIAPENWCKLNSKKKVNEDIALTVFLRIKFFLPTNFARNIQGGEWRYRVYLQLRRATVEGQLSSSIQNLILLAGYALHIEFGEFFYREHGTGDYFLLEHYLPESAITHDMADIKLRMKKAHESRRGLDRNKAVINYITLAQTFRDYGAHFYSAIWATRDGFCRDVWLSIGPRGVTLYSRNSQLSDETGNYNSHIVLQSLPWHHIQTFYYNKKGIYIIPNTHSGLSKIGIKYKLKTTESKSYFIYWLASLHHKLYSKLYAKEDFINYLSDELSYPLNTDKNPITMDCSNYEDSYNLAVRNPIRIRRPVRRRFKVDIFSDKKTQNKENKPNTEELLKRILEPIQVDDSTQNIKANSSNDGLSSSESYVSPRRHGVKMGTRVFNGMKSLPGSKYPKSSTYRYSSEYFKSEGDLTTTPSDSDDLSSEQRQYCNINSMKLLPERQYTQELCHAATAYVLESPKVYSDVYNLNMTTTESCLNTSLFEKLDNLGCVQGERVFVTAILERNETNALGLQVAEGSDGNIYVKSIVTGGPADLCRQLLPGDQIISVNGQTLLNVKYDKALQMLQMAPKKVEIIVLQNVNRNSYTASNNYPSNTEDSKIRFSKKNIGHSIASALDMEVTDDELLNEEALKTIYALIKLTKDKVISRMKDKNTEQTTPCKGTLKKCYSENQMYEDTDTGNYSSQENTPQKKNKFSTSRLDLSSNRVKHRPLSLSIPSNFAIPDDYLSQDIDILMKNSSLKSIKTSLRSLDKPVTSLSCKNVALPRNYGLSRRWLGPVRYPVTPSKREDLLTDKSAIDDSKVMKKHFIYGVGDSDEDQIFL